MKRRATIRCTLALATAVMLSACGFHLRGSGIETNLPFKTIYLGFPTNSSLGVELKRYIDSSGTTKVVTAPTEAQALLDVISETREKAVLTLNSQGRVREYSLIYKLNFRVRDNQGRELLAPTEIALKRDISFNESQVLAKETEEATLYRNMQTDVVQQVLRRLATIKSVETKNTDSKPTAVKPAQ